MAQERDDSPGRVVSVFGPFGSRALVDMPLADAMDYAPLPESRRTHVVTATLRELEELRARAPKVADSATAAAALQLAYELEHPYNSATSKSMCAAKLLEALRELREMAGPEVAHDGIDKLVSRFRSARRSDS